MTHVQVFISSRERELEPEREIAARVLKSFGMRPIRFETDLVPQGVGPKTAYLKGTEQSQILVLILWKEYSEAVRQEFHRAQAAGIDILCLIKEPRQEERQDRKLQKFIEEIEAQQISVARFRSLDSLERGIQRGLALSFAKRLTSPIKALGKEALIRAGTILFREAVVRVILVARTPMPVVGTRPYGQPGLAIPYEREHLEAFKSLIEAAGRGSGASFRCIASISAIGDELQTGSPEFRDHVRERVRALYRTQSQAVSRLELRWIPRGQSMPMAFLVADDSFIIWLKDPSGENVWIESVDARIARALDFLSSQDVMSQKLGRNTALKELGLQ